MQCSLRPWDPMNDIVQFENNFVIQTKTRHQTPIVHTTSIVGLDEKKSRGSHAAAAAGSLEGVRAARHKRSSAKHLRSVSSRGSGSSSAVQDDRLHRDSISSLSGGTSRRHCFVFCFTFICDSMYQKELHSFIHSLRPFLWCLFKSTSSQKRSRHSTDTVPEFHAKVPQATTS